MKMLVLVLSAFLFIYIMVLSSCFVAEKIDDSMIRTIRIETWHKGVHSQTYDYSIEDAYNTSGKFMQSENLDSLTMTENNKVLFRYIKK
jgi:hypothetical protein